MLNERMIPLLKDQTTSTLPLVVKIAHENMKVCSILSCPLHLQGKSCRITAAKIQDREQSRDLVFSHEESALTFSESCF